MTSQGVPSSDLKSDLSKIAAVRDAWNLGLQDSDVESLLALMTEDIVLVYANGRCVSGKNELRAELSHHFGLFDTERRVTSSDVIVHGRWAFQIGGIESTEAAVRGGPQLHSRARSMAVLARQSDSSWKLARMIDLVD
jgi:ketosteroid isomerase-like protein